MSGLHENRWFVGLVPKQAGKQGRSLSRPPYPDFREIIAGWSDFCNRLGEIRAAPGPKEIDKIRPVAIVRDIITPANKHINYVI
jgi:hypothetical protein